MLAAMPAQALLRYRESFEAAIAESPLDEIDPAQLADARGLIEGAIARARPPLFDRALLNLLAAFLLAIAILLWLASLIGTWLFVSLLIGG